MTFSFEEDLRDENVDGFSKAEATELPQRLPWLTVA
jgi:hypothetical protein